jgi:hypothetical protein
MRFIIQTKNMGTAPGNVYDIFQRSKRIFDAGLPRRHGLRLAEGW